MSDEDNGGLFIAGEKLTASDADHASMLRVLTTNPEHRDNPDIQSQDRATARAAQDPRRRDIVAALMSATSPMHYDSLKAADQDVTMRQQAIAVMAQMNIGALDADYFDPGPSQVHPRIGGTYYDPTSPPAVAPPTGKWHNDRFWQTANISDPWEYEFDQQDGISASAALEPIFPFRGECAGALQICAFKGALAALGAAGFDAQHPDGRLKIGPWDDDVRVYLQKVPLTDPMIPGDYYYFKNKDDYPTYAPDGFWQGLNCLYVGNDQLSTPRYSGLGAAWQSEAELRTTMGFAYAGDCHPHIVTDPATEIRFTVHARLVLGTAPPPAPAPAEVVDAGSTSAPTPEMLHQLSFEEARPGVFVHRGLRLKDLATGLGFQHGMLRQTISAPAFNPSSRVALGGARCVLHYHGETDHRANPDAMVQVTLNLNTSGGAVPAR